ncbi:FAD-binding protein [Youxingia wuxianensis]|nr:FAD-binding protein [Youxingia wuxianensis]
MRFQTDVLVIGAGGAACRAAIEAADCGARVLMVSKKPLGNAGATCFPVAEMAGYNAGNPDVPGDIERHYEDIVSAGQGMVDPALAQLLAEQAPDTISRLIEWGVSFEMEDGDFYIFKSCFSESARTHVIRGHGKPIIEAMTQQIKKRHKIQILDRVTIAGLLMDCERCAGAFGWDAEGKSFIIESGSVVLATGGTTQAFLRNMNPLDVTGDGYTIGHEAGAKLINMEFMQVGMCFSHPVINMFNAYLWEGMPRLYNGENMEFLTNYLPEGLSSYDVMHEHRRHFPFSTSDASKYLEIAAHKEICNGRGTEHGGIVADLSHMTDSYIQSLEDDCGIHHMWPIARDYMLHKGVDLLKQKAEVAVFAHATSGGLVIDKSASTKIPGLFAAGEVAGGSHGANRLGGNMMVTCQVFGAIAGKNAALSALQNPVTKLDSQLVAKFVDRKKELLLRVIDTEGMILRLKECNQENLLINRSEVSLNFVLQMVDQLQKEINNAPLGNVINLRNFELYSLMYTSQIMAISALQRKESRGSHHRVDYPEKNNLYNRAFVL